MENDDVTGNTKNINSAHFRFWEKERAYLSTKFEEKKKSVEETTNLIHHYKPKHHSTTF